MNYGNEKLYGPINRDCPPTESMDPYTIQITKRLSDAEKQLSELLERIYKLNEKLFGPIPMLAKAGDSVGNVPAKAMMEQIVGQSNFLCRKLADLSEALNRLETL